MAAPILLSALGRDAQVGSLYNYFTDAILPSEIELPEEGKRISHAARSTTLSYFFQQPDKFKCKILGINSHLLQSIEKGLPDSHQPWFADYLNATPKDSDANEAQITIVCRLVRRTETLVEQFLQSKMYEYHKIHGGQATHLINEVVYGAEVICSVRRSLLNLQQETKETIERSIYLETREYLSRLVVGESALTDLPVKLEKISCTVLSSLEAGRQSEMSFLDFSRYLKNFCNPDKDDNHLHNWKPIELLLSAIPTKLEFQVWFEVRRDFAEETKRHQLMWTWIQQTSIIAWTRLSTNRFPPFEKVIGDLQNILPSFRKKIEECSKVLETYHPQYVLREISIHISYFLDDLILWLTRLIHKMDEFFLQTRDTMLIALDWAGLENRMAKTKKKNVEVFVLTVKYRHIINYMANVGSDPISTASLPVLPIISYEKKTYECLRSALKEFAKEAGTTSGGLFENKTYYIELSSALSSSDDDAMKTDVNFGQLTDISTDDSSTIPRSSVIAMGFEENQQSQIENTRPLLPGTSSDPLEPSTDEKTTMTSLLSPQPFDSEISGEEGSRKTTEDLKSAREKIPLEVTYPFIRNVERTGEMEVAVEHVRQELPLEQTGQLHSNDAKLSVAAKITKNKEVSKTLKYHRSVSESSASSVNFVTCPPSPHQHRNLDKHNESHVEGVEKNQCNKTMESETASEKNSRLSTKGSAVFDKQRRIAEMFRDESSKVLKTGPPDTYLLSATEKLNGGDIKWFDISRPGKISLSIDHKKHKIIILMGATGSGKSTLINGMINYILGVQWNDPFRFKCVREDENVKSQSHSQTSSVTAYTLHHQDGMTIPYSITIIDTPGYGDTRGMKRDKEITANIHQFLTQQETGIDEIHAACFVAASGDSRLTAIQRYIIDSVLSIFGKDMKDNLRLLVTFADNADPPVVGACLGANFPITSESAGLTYSKFNSSVLYCSNAKKEEDEFGVDELFWDMGQENFQKFFVMLEGMKGKDLKSTREVIHSRCQMKQSLTDIEQEMEVCLTNIENIEILQREMKICRSMFTCPNGLFAYNCQRCHDTCERQIPSYLCKGKITCKRQQCKCPASQHRVEHWEWRMDPEKMSVRCLDLKAKYEKSSKHKMTIEELLDTCSENLQLSKGKALSLLDQVAQNVQLLESKALRSNVVSPSDYLSLMKCRVLEEKAPGYLARIETLDELQRMLVRYSRLTRKKKI